MTTLNASILSKKFKETTQKLILEKKILAEKSKLAATDYKVIKCSECLMSGLPLPYDIVALNIERQVIRDKINTLEG